MPRESHSFPSIARPRRLHGIVPAAILAAAASCGDAHIPPGEGTEHEGSPPIEFRDSAGVILATARLTPETPAWRVDPEPELILGQVEGEAAYLFQRPAFAARLSDGRVVVADFGSGQVRWFDSEGLFLHSVGRKGDGPWEFREFNRVVRIPGDTLLVYDFLNARVTRLGPDGEPLSELSLRDVYASRLTTQWRPLLRPEFRTIGSGAEAHLARWRNLMFAGPLAEARHAIAFLRSGSLPPHPQVDTMRTHALIARVGTNGDEIGVLAESPGTLQIPMWRDQRPPRGAVARPVDVPFATEALMAGRGELHVVSETGSYELRGYDADGVLRRIIRRADVTPVRVTWELMERYIGWSAGSSGSAMERLVRDVATSSFELAGENYHLPTHAELFLDPAGRIWVEDWRFPWDEGEPRTFAVFEPEGRIVATATVPPQLWITDIGLDHVTGVVWDDVGVEYVHVYRIRR